MQNYETRRCRDATKYPEKFKCYWGTCKYQEEREPIYQNRNEFVEEFDITSYQSKDVPERMKHIFYYDLQDQKFDHVEMYKTKDKKTILVNSPYTKENDEWFLERGYIIYKPLYASHARTYIKVVSKYDHFVFFQKVKMLRMQLRKERKKYSKLASDFEKRIEIERQITSTYPIGHIGEGKELPYPIIY